uniref:IQ domain-containing protein H n=1 Tax=Schistosoma haematobium TaxID=6185 RepID=A0A095BXU2_SCHHA
MCLLLFVFNRITLPFYTLISSNNSRNILSLSHELALKATEEYCSPAEFADDILKLNDRCLLAQRSKVSFERTENKEINTNTKESGQVDAIDLYPLKHLSPGEKFKLENALKILSDPSHPFNRQTVQNAYGIQLPTILQTRVTEEQQRQNKKMQESKSQSNVALTTVRKKKRDLKLIQYDETSDNNCNALNLIQRGLIPSNAQITFDPSPMQTKSMHLISPSTKLPQQPITINDLCPIYEPTNIHEVPKPITLKKKSRSVLSDSKSVAVRDVSKVDRNTESVFITENPTLSRRQASSKATPPPCTPITTCSSHGNFWLTTEEGLFQTQSEDYQAFEAQFTDNWDKISILLCELENLFDFYGISVAVVNGIKLAKLAKDYENNLGSLTSDILLTSIEDSQTIRRIMTEPGSSFRGRQGPTRAAIKIQSTFRRYRAQKQYDEQKRLRGAAAIISTSWIRYKKMKQLRERLSNTRKYCTEISQKKLKELVNNWERFEQNSHVVVHLPSASYSESIRQQLGSIEELEYMESRQIARICEIRNPNRDVVIVTRAPISDDLLEYYNKLLGLTTAIETGQAENQCSISSRYRIIVPEAIKYFHSNAPSPMCLASLLKYSPRALKHIRRFIAGRPAILIPGFGEHDDIFYVANCLEIPVWSSTPSINSLFTLQSTTRRLVKQLLDTLSDRDISTDLKNQNISKASALFTSVITSRRKVIDDTRTNKLVEGFGKFKKDIDKFVTGQNYWPVEQPPGDFDIYTMDHETTYVKILSEVPQLLQRHLKLFPNSFYTDSTSFIEAFLKHGGVIEACPPIDEWTNLSVVIAILPNKTVRIVASGDQLHSEDKFYTWGETIRKFLNQNLLISIVFVVPMSSVTPLWNEQILWITDIKPGYTDLLAMTQLVLFATNTTFKINQSTGEHEIIAKPPTILLEKMIAKSQETVISNEIQENKFKRYAIVSTRLHHSNLTMIQYSVFFKICRANYIGYNLKDRQGILFSPMDSYRRDRLALVSISESLEEALRKFGSTLKILHKEVSTPNMTGISNFQSVIKEVEQILGQVIENSLEQNMLTTMKEKEIHMNQSIKPTQQNKKIMKK